MLAVPSKHDPNSPPACTQHAEVNVQRGVKQGDNISPKLFNCTLRMALDRIDWQNLGITINGCRLTTLTYADDVVVVARNRSDLATMIGKLIVECGKVGLQVHPAKTMLLTENRKQKQPLSIRGQQFLYQEGGKYLGRYLSFPIDNVKEIKRRIQSGWNAWGKLSELLRHHLVSTEAKRRAFDACITPCVLYGCEAWTLRETDRELLAITQRKMERRMLKLRWQDRWTKERVRQATGVKDWVMEAERRKLVWANKIRKMDDTKWARKMTTWIPYDYANKRGQGRPKER
ncbi:hypothetical protein PRIPAC_87760 [Pristionchus pacificus]|uniref:Reverse transcriptase domain-containing protein n=1 Tax=Pristionchus pacificus TaxID=54126 RepID=A0A2A6CY99_PRIPA|nr:hypothetical protein PRIPAC_87760 [Pristionchus pacificus]|eukprot:PDM83066.1 hypothetical protein PRIPAC_37459 [Pristionchus pacificus]